MEKLKTRLRFSFSTKVLIPVLTTMVLLLALTVWIVNRRITRQFETAATDSLKTADRVFLRFRKIRRQERLFRYRNLLGEEKVDTICVGGRLYDVVSMPVLGTGDHLIGALTLGLEVGEAAAQELRDVAQCQIVLLGNGQVVVATLPGPEWHNCFAHLFNEYAPVPGPSETPAPINSIK